MTESPTPPPDLPAPVAPARPAATVVVIDQHDDRYSVLMVQRNPALRFYGGYWVFPGGAIDLADGRFETDAAAQAGCRELREEAGLRVAPADLAYWARWITPSGFPKRFDTRFYVAKRPADQQPRVIDGEVTALSWLPLASWPSLREGGDFPVPFATQFVLRELAEELERHGSLAALLAIATTRPILTILPKMLSDEVSVLPWDPDYDTLSGDGITWSAEQVAARDHWPSRG